MAKVTYTAEGNHICLSNGTKEKHLEWIHEGLLRVYEKKNSEELVHLNYRNELVASKIVALGKSKCRFSFRTICYLIDKKRSVFMHFFLKFFKKYFLKKCIL